MSPFARLVRRDLARAFAHGGAWLPLVFYLLVATLFPFAIGPDAALLGKVGSGALWTAALLAALLPVERLVRPDIAAGSNYMYLHIFRHIIICCQSHDGGVRGQL